VTPQAAKIAPVDDLPAADDAPNDAPPPAGQVAKTPPTREQIRQRLRTALAAGTINQDELLCDIAAAIYDIEISVHGMFAMASRVPGFGKMRRKMERQFQEGTEDGDE
jgi:hypothetical protein